MLPSSESDMFREVGRSRLNGRESGEEGCMAAFGRGNGGDGGAFLSRQRDDACLLLLDVCTGSGGVLTQGSELVVEGSDQPFMLDGGELGRVAIGGGGCVVLGGHPSAG